MLELYKEESLTWLVLCIFVVLMITAMLATMNHYVPVVNIFVDGIVTGISTTLLVMFIGYICI